MPESIVYCYRCRLLLSHCICADRPVIESSLHWCLLTHPAEMHKRNNSGFHVNRMLGDSVSVIPWSRVDPTLNQQCELGKDFPPVLLFPGSLVANQSQVFSDYQSEWQGRPLMILDATWQQAKKMYRQSDWLQSLPVWDLSNSLERTVVTGFQYGLRRNQTEFGCSTIETVAHVMALQAEMVEAQSMLSYFDAFQQDTNDPSQRQ